MGIQDALDNLRQEIQQDRLELHRTMTEGFNRISDRYEEISDRVTKIEDSQTAIRRTIGGAVSATFAAFVAYLFTMFGR